VSPRLRVAIAGHPGRVAARRAATRLATRLARRGCAVRLERTFDAGGEPLESLAAWCQLLIVLGGDGSVLAGGRALAGRRARLLGINFGGLGFLAAAEQSEMDAAVDAALDGRWPVRARRLLRARVRRGGRARVQALAMNDVVVKGVGGRHAVHLRMRALGQDLGHLVADGIITATAAGSTAYSLSAGGPVLSSEVEALVVTPVCAHSLGSRSLVLAGSDEVTLRVIGSLEPVTLLVDGRVQCALEAGDEVAVGLGRTAVRCVVNPERPFARSLQGKLGWQGSTRRSL
jgi:NAD+ kinase